MAGLSAGAPTGFSVGAGGTYNVGLPQLQSTLEQVLPTQQTFSGSMDFAAPKNVTPLNTTGNQGVMSAFMQKLGNVGSEIGHLAVGAANWIGKEAVQSVEAPVKLAYYTYNFAKDEFNYESLNQQRQDLSNQQTNLMNDYKAGRITRDQYNDGLKQINADLTKWHQQFTEAYTKINDTSKKGVAADVNFEGDIVAALTSGIAKPLEAGAAPGVNGAVKFLTGEGSKAGDALAQASQKVAQVMNKVPGLGTKGSTVATEAIQRITQETVQAVSPSLTTTQVAKSVATNLLIKKPLVYNQVAAMGAQTYQQLEQGKYGDAVKNMALFTGMALAGGPVGWAMQRLKGAGSLIKTGLFGQTSFMDLLSQRIGDGNAQGLYNFLSRPENIELAKSFKAMESTNITAANGNVQEAVNRIANWYEQENGIALKGMSHEQLAQDLHTTFTDQQAVKAALIKSGYSEEEASRAAVGRWSIQDNKQLQGELIKADQIAEQQAVAQGGDAMASKLAARRAVIQELQDQYGRNAAWLNSDTLQSQLDTVFQTHENTQDMIKAIDAIDAQHEIPVDKATQDLLRQNGHIAIIPEKGVKYASYEETNGKIASRFTTKGSPDYFAKSTSPLPVLGTVGNVLTRLGMSPEAAGSAVQQSFMENFGAELGNKGLGLMGDENKETAQRIMNSLSDYAKNPTARGQITGVLRRAAPITDYRQMTLDEIRTALGTGTSVVEAKNVRDALMTAMLKVPLEIRGLGDKVMDMNYKYNPLSRQYARVQGAGRYVWNPFFQWQKTTQTEFLAQMEGGGKFLTYGPTDWLAKNIFKSTYQELDNTVDMLRSKGILGDELNIGRTGEGNYDQGVGKVGTRLLKGEQRSLAGLVQTMARKVNMSPGEFVDNYNPETTDVLRTIVNFGKNEKFVNSPLARTLNFAFFPARYNLKIAGMMAGYVSRLSAPMQVALIHSMMQFGDFLKSDEGQAWYSQNSDVIGIFNYISPLWSLNQLSNILTHPGTISSYGVLGGLPFGFISQMLQSQGLIQMGQPYVNPKTGEELPNYIPNTTKGRANAAIQDLLGQLFSYPGSTMGLPSKTKVLKTVAGGIVPGSSKDFTAVTPPLDAQEARFQQNIQGRNGNGTTTTPNGSTFVHFNGPTLMNPNTQKANLPLAPAKNSGGSGKKKKSEFTPQLLPGQTQLGAIPGAS